MYIPHIPTAHIEPRLEARNRYDAIPKLFQLLIRAGSIPREAETAMLAALIEREKIMSTGIGFRLGIPHIFSDAVSAPVVAFGLSRSGIAFDSPDDVPVEFVFLFIFPASGYSKLEKMRLMAKDYFRPAARPSIQGALRDCSTAEEIAAVFRRVFTEEDGSAEDSNGRQ